eukprot:UN05684
MPLRGSFRETHEVGTRLSPRDNLGQCPILECPLDYTNEVLQRFYERFPGQASLGCDCSQT